MGDDTTPGLGFAVSSAFHEANAAGAAHSGPPGLTTAHLRCPRCGLDRYEWVPVRRPELVPLCPCGELPDLVSAA